MSTIGPEMPGQQLYAVGSAGKPPSCTSTTIDFTPCCFSFLAAALAVSTSSVNFRPCDAGLGDDVRGVLQGHADEADLHAVVLLDDVRPGTRVLPVSSCEHVGRRGTGSRRPGRCRSGQEFWLSLPSPSVEAATVLHPQQLAPALVELVVADAGDSRPILFIASMVGSSWKARREQRLAPIRSPAATVTRAACVGPGPRAQLLQVGGEELRAAGRGVVDGRPGTVRSGSRGSRWPWKSLIARIWSLTLGLTGCLWAGLWRLRGHGGPWASGGAAP